MVYQSPAPLFLRTWKVKEKDDAVKGFSDFMRSEERSNGFSERGMGMGMGMIDVAKVWKSHGKAWGNEKQQTIHGCFPYFSMLPGTSMGFGWAFCKPGPRRSSYTTSHQNSFDCVPSYEHYTGWSHKFLIFGNIVSQFTPSQALIHQFQQNPMKTTVVFPNTSPSDVRQLVYHKQRAHSAYFPIELPIRTWDFFSKPCSWWCRTLLTSSIIPFVLWKAQDLLTPPSNSAERLLERTMGFLCHAIQDASSENQGTCWFHAISPTKIQGDFYTLV